MVTFLFYILFFFIAAYTERSELACLSDAAILIFSVQTKLVKPKAMEPLTPVALRGPVPIPPQRANKAANAVSSGINQTKLTSAVPPNVINSLSGPEPGNVMSICSC